LNCFRFVLGLVNSGTSIGSVVATPLIIMLQGAVGWQATFVAMGSLGFVWLALWLRYYEAPERHQTITAEELAVIQEGREKADGRGAMFHVGRVVEASGDRGVCVAAVRGGGRGVWRAGGHRGI
jgi:MFS family permease